MIPTNPTNPTPNLANTSDALWKSLVDGSYGKRKGAMIIFNQINKYREYNHDAGLRQGLIDKGYDIKDTIVNIENHSVATESIKQLKNKIKQFFRQNYYISVLYLLGHSDKSDSNKRKTIDVYIQKQKGQTDKSKLVEVSIRTIFNLWKPKSIKHLLICLEMCYLGTATKIFKEEYSHLTSMSILTSSNKNEYIIGYNLTTKNVISPFRILVLDKETKKLSRPDKKFFVESVSYKQLDTTGLFNYPILFDEFINKQRILKLEKDQNLASFTMVGLKTMLNNIEKNKLNEKIQFSDDKNDNIKSIYFGGWVTEEKDGVTKKVRNGNGSFWFNYQGREIFYCGESKLGTFTGKGYIKVKIPQKQYKFQGWGNFIDGKITGQCSVEIKKNNKTNRILTTMWNHPDNYQPNGRHFALNSKFVQENNEISKQLEFTTWEGKWHYKRFYEHPKDNGYCLNLTVRKQEQESLPQAYREIANTSYQFIKQSELEELGDEFDFDYDLSQEKEEEEEQDIPSQKIETVWKISKLENGKITTTFSQQNQNQHTRQFSCLREHKLKNPVSYYFDKKQDEYYQFKLTEKKEGTYLKGFYGWKQNGRWKQPEDLGTSIQEKKEKFESSNKKEADYQSSEQQIAEQPPHKKKPGNLQQNSLQSPNSGLNKKQEKKQEEQQQ